MFQRKSDGRWLYQRTLPNGKTATISARTQAELLKRREELDGPIREHRPRPEKVTIGAVLGRYLEDFAAQVNAGEKSPSTLRTYRGLVRDQILPALGGILATNLTTRQVNTWLTGLDLKDSTRRKCRAVLVSALSWAETDGLVSRNAARASKVTARERVTESAFLTVEECNRLREHVKGNRLEPLVLLALGAGLRRGELLGLTWSEVNLDAASVTVRRALTYDQEGKTVLSDPKTEKSARVAHVLPFAIEALRRHWHALDVIPLDKSEALVFTSTAGTPLDPNNLGRDFANLTEGAGIGRRHVHELRHGYAKEMLRQGVPLHVVSKQLGHASIVITADIYGHAEATESDALLAAGATAFG